MQYCGKCGYCLEGIEGPPYRCPECGLVSYGQEQAPFKTGIAVWLFVIVHLIVFAGSLVLMIVPDFYWPKTTDWDHRKELLYKAYSFGEFGSLVCFLVGILGLIVFRKSDFRLMFILQFVTAASALSLLMLSHAHS